jgi:hypothetical protein
MDSNPSNMNLKILGACREAAEADIGQNMTSEAGLTLEAIARLNGTRSRNGHFVHYAGG